MKKKKPMPMITKRLGGKTPVPADTSAERLFSRFMKPKKKKK